MKDKNDKNLFNEEPTAENLPIKKIEKTSPPASRKHRLLKGLTFFSVFTLLGLLVFAGFVFADDDDDDDRYRRSRWSSSGPRVGAGGPFGLGCQLLALCEQTNDGKIELLLSKADGNKDKKISETEYRSLIKDRFGELDEDNDKQLSVAELIATFREFREKLPMHKSELAKNPDRVKARLAQGSVRSSEFVIDRFDENRDKTLSLEEFYPVFVREFDFIDKDADRVLDEKEISDFSDRFAQRMQFVRRGWDDDDRRERRRGYGRGWDDDDRRGRRGGYGRGWDDDDRRERRRGYGRGWDDDDDRRGRRGGYGRGWDDDDCPGCY